MKMILTLFLIFSTTSSYAVEGESKAHSLLKKKYIQVSLGYHFWHESVEINSSGTDGQMSTQFHGFKFGGSYQKPFKQIRWVQYYGADFAFGKAKGTAEGALTDQLEDQPWLSATFSPGILYRSTAVSEIALVLPVAYRRVEWKLANNTNLEVNDTALSVGLGAIFTTRFNPYSSLAISMTHQHMWTATIWGIAWQYDFKK